MRVSFDSLLLSDGNAAPAVDMDGNIWMVHGLVGWESAPPQTGLLSYTMRDGSTVAQPTYGSRPLTVSGLTKCPNEAMYWKAYNSLADAMNVLVIPVPLTVREKDAAGADLDKTVYVVRATSNFRMTLGVSHFTWELPLVGLDPLKYGASASQGIASGGTQVITNVGNYPSGKFTITVTGAGTLRLLHNGTGARLSSGTNSLPVGTVLNVRDRTVLSAGVDLYGLLSPTSQWWELLAGTNSITNAGTANVTIDYRPAWI